MPTSKILGGSFEPLEPPHPTGLNHPFDNGTKINKTASALPSFFSIHTYLHINNIFYHLLICKYIRIEKDKTEVKKINLIDAFYDRRLKCFNP